ncbi:MAG: DUF2950 domain-containing protein [Acidobacteriaceae bacterium]|nr:DUF2950 domain-containing protein [Acidobacteriaceae bacterium]
MFDFVRKCASTPSRHLLLALGIALLLPPSACKKQESATAQTGPGTFASPQDAGKALADAAKSQNQDELLRIFGPGTADIISTGDAVQDKTALSGFAQSYQVMHRWRKLSDSSNVLLVGADNQAFPIPLNKNSTGQWYFDAAAGRDEILSRRIGHNEITTIGVCSALVDAQSEYFSQKHGGVKQYAQKFISDPGQENGLYWADVSSQRKSPLGPLAAYATAEGYKVDPNHHQPFNGYYYLMLKKQGPNAVRGAKNYIINGKMTGGFAIVAYPAKYGNSGVMTFMINQDGTLLQKDLGRTTEQVASTMTEFNPDTTWTVVEE